MNRNSYLFILIFIAFIISIVLIIDNGKDLEKNRAQKLIKIEIAKSTSSSEAVISNKDTDKTPFSIKKLFSKNIKSPISILIIQILILIALSRILGIVFAKLGQPIVIGEIIAGILLGPSLLGTISPEAYQFLFPASSLGYLQILSQIGLILFMFVVGMELDINVLRNKLDSAFVISYSGIVFPYFLGVSLSYFLFETFAPAHTSYMAFALFIGIALSITAFPVLARIIHERGLSKTAVGRMAITCAATDDVSAWIILAIIIAIIQAGTAFHAILIVALVALYISTMLFVIQPLFKRIGNTYFTAENISRTLIAVVMLHLFFSAFLAEMLGIHTLFGAFIAGIVIPSNQKFKRILTDKIEDISITLFLPLFFAFTGLRTQIGLLNTGSLWIVCAIVILFAILGKLGGISIASRILGFSWKDSFTMGVLMNTRGLMELIALNIGYDLGILSPEIFTIMVIMALVTTFMTGPLLTLINFFNRKKILASAITGAGKLRILISFGPAKMGATLLNLTKYFINNKLDYQITAMHLTPKTEVSSTEASNFEKISFAPINSLAKKLDVHVENLYKTSNDVAKEIIKISKDEKASILFIGAAKSVFSSNILGGKVRTVVDKTKCNTGVFIDKSFNSLNNILIIADKKNVSQMLSMADLLLMNISGKIMLIDSDNSQLGIKSELFDSFIAEHKDEDRIEILNYVKLDMNTLEQFDLIMLGLKYCETALKEKSLLLDSKPSLLILNFYDDTFNYISQPITA
jgi:Kef-type K+ transport system membrane component KefB